MKYLYFVVFLFIASCKPVADKENAEPLAKVYDNYLYETYELVINNNQVNNKDIMYLDN